MTYPTKYSRLYDFASYQNANPTRPLPGDRVNFDLNAIKQSVTEIVDFLKGPIRSDGKLMNKTVGRDQLADNVNLGFDAPTDWAPATIYTLANTVFHGNIFYKANTNHTSGDTFDASKWDVIADFSAAVTAAAASADAAAASETSAAASETNATAAAVATAADRVATGEDKAAAEAAQAAAATSASSAASSVATFSTKADAEASAFLAAPDRIETRGYTVLGKGGGVYENNGTTTGDLVITLADATTLVGYDLVSEVLDQYMFGAVGDGAADDTTPVKNLVTAAEASGREIKALPGLHKVTDTIVLLKSADFRACVFFADATVVSPVIRVGEQASASAAYSQVYYAPKLVNSAKYSINPASVLGFDKIGAGWTGFENSIGIDCATVNNCYIWLRDIYGFGVGFNGGGFGNGFSYNRVFVNMFLNNQVGYRLKPGNDTGWANENTTFGGRWTYDVDEGTALANCHDIQLIKSTTGAPFPPDNNLFIQPSVESDTPQHTIYLQASFNKFLNPRFDGAGKIVIINSTNEGVDGCYNSFEGGYGLGIPGRVFFFEFGERCYGNSVVSPRFICAQGGLNNPALALSASYNDGSAAPHIVGYAAFEPVVGKGDLATAANAQAWVYNLNGAAFVGKRPTDTSARLNINLLDGALSFGNGSGDLATLAYGGTSIIVITGSFLPAVDNAYNIGGPSNRFGTIYAASSTINTSDAREKDWRGGLNDVEMRVARRLSKLVGIYRWKDAIAKKGDAARLHAGALAQDVQAAFAAEGLDGFAYGVLCHDTWEARAAEIDKDDKIITPAIEAGERYGLRYDELWAFIAVGFEARLAALENAQAT